MKKKSVCWIAVSILLLVATEVGLFPTHAASLGPANGSFETGDLSGYTVSGDVSVVESLGVVWPTDRQWMALMTTTPDAGPLPGDADVSSLEVDFQIPAGTTHLRFDVDFLTNELDPSLANDYLLVSLVTPGDQLDIYRADTLSAMSPAAGSGYAVHTDWVAVRYEVSAWAGDGQTYTLRFELHDLGDGRLDSAATIDQIYFFVDADGDGYPASDDCNDNDPLVNPGMTEIPFNNKDDDCNPATLDGLETDLRLSKTVEPPVVQSRDMVTYTLVYSNVGGVDAADVVLTDLLPPGLVVTRTGGVTITGIVSWTLGNVPAGEGGAVILTATVEVTNAAHATLTNMATLHSAALELDYGNNTAAVNNELVQMADLVVTDINLNGVGADHQTLIVGGTGKATIRNRGSLDVPANRPFVTVFFEDRNGDGAYDPAVDNSLGQAIHSGGLAAGTEVVVPALVTGQVLFRDNLVYVFVDSGDAVAEQNEANNIGDTGAHCEYRPTVGQFDPVLEWAWTGSTTLPNSDQVMMTPLVADLTMNGTPEIVFASFTDGDEQTNGHLRAISGSDGSEILTVTDSNYDLHASSGLAVGDLDLDGQLEILGGDESGYRIIAFEHDGTFKWRSPVIPGGPSWGSVTRGCVSIADIDRDGIPEAVIGDTVLNGDGTIRWAGGFGRADNDRGPLSLVADLDLAGDPELVAGNTAYRSDGSVYWRNSSLTDGFNAVADFDADPYPELVLVTQQKVYLLEHDGTVKWGPSFLPGASFKNNGGAPTVADVDGDGALEIGVAGGYAYSVFETDGTLKWSRDIQDFTSGNTGSSMFDFERDGSMEVVYSDELKLYIYRGIDGATLFETPLSSATVYENPVLVDVDADGNTEIVVSATSYGGFGPERGVYIYGDANDTWVPTRQIWNQHSYHIDNVNDDGTIPQFEQPSWLTHNTYRCQAAPQPFRAPDLTASRLLFDSAGLPSSLHITARIGNGGALHTGAGLPVAFYDGDPVFGGTLIGVAHTSQPLQPGEYEDVTLEWISPTLGLHDVYVVADDDGTGSTQNECDEVNNTHHQTVDTLTVAPDLVVPQIDRSGPHTDLQALTITGTIAAEIQNQGNLAAAGSFNVAFFEDLDGNGVYSDTVDNLLAQTTHDGGLGIGASAWVTAPVSGTVLFRDNLIYAFADSGNVVLELDETNNLNQTGAPCQYLPLEGQFQPVLEWAWTGSSVLPDSNQVMMTPAVVDLTGDDTPDIIFISFTDGNEHTDGHVRAINGRDGNEVFTVTDPAYDVYASGNIAVGDIDLDGHPEIVAGTESGTEIITFEADGTFKWRSPTIPGGGAHGYGSVGYGGATIADIDQNGIPEIVIGSAVLNNDGTIRWMGSLGHGDHAWGPLSLVADLDLMGNPEVVAGNTAYRSDGSIYWHNGSLTDGFNAIGNFDDDLYPEVVLVTVQKVYLLEHDGTVKWGPAYLPGGGSYNWGGAPTVADVDGDNRLEVGVAGEHAYAVFDTDGTLKWSSPVQDQSFTTGSSVFDFEGDGSAEIVYGDELALRIYRGADGVVLFETPLSNATIYENPVIADVDSDGNAEIVATANTYCDLGPQRGVYVFGDSNDNWVPTRQIWNQHTYHITNVNDDGTIPQFETNNWQVPYGNNYRLNTQTERPVPYYAAPDLTTSYIRIDMSSLSTSVRFTARIGNGGANIAAADLPVAFYEGDPAVDGTLLGVISTTVNLDPGEYEDMTFEWISPTLGGHDLYVVADDDGTSQGTANECDEANNVHWLHYAIGPERPDLVVPQIDRGGLSTDFQALTIDGTIAAEIENQGALEVTASFDVAFFEDLDGDGVYSHTVDNLLGQTTHTGGLGIGASAWVSALVDGKVLFRDNLIHAFVDSGQAISEEDETNNLNNTGTACEYRPPVGHFNPVVERFLPVDTPYGVISTPIVANLNDDNGDGRVDTNDIPEVVFVDSPLVCCTTGHLHIFRGDTGEHLFASPQDVLELANVAIGDIDNDELPEIVAAGDGGTVIVWENDGTFKWQSVPLPDYPARASDSGTLAIANLDSTGTPEIVIGHTVLDSLGNIVATGTGGKGYNGVHDAISSIADINLDGRPEIVAGNTAYALDGSTLSIVWQNNSVPDGFTAIGDFDDDPFPEIVLVNNGLYLLEHDGSIKWHVMSLPGGGEGGPPTIGDMNGDSSPEIAVAGLYSYAVFGADGTLLWSAMSHDVSSRNTGSTVFDFDGDGHVEVIYRDELSLRVFRGADGLVLFEANVPSDTGSELPVVADVDRDGNAELLVATNTHGMYSGGVLIYGDANDNWVPTRQIWNQHTYHVNNVNDDGSIPQFEEPSWLTHNTYRCNIVTDPFRAPDLTASRLLFDSSGLPDSLQITARIGNGGSLLVAAGIPVAFYDGDPLTGGILISTTLTSRPLAPGEYEDVTVTWLAPPLGLHTIYVVADDTGAGQGTANECDETNNLHSRGYIVWPDRVPDLILTNTVTPPVVTSGDVLTYTLIYSNAGPADAANVLLADILPDGVTPSAAEGLIPTSALTWTLGTVAAGEGGTIILTATVDLTGTAHAVFSNMAVITTTTPEGDMANNAALAVNELFQEADLMLSKSVTPPVVQPGDLLTYTIVYSNLGLADAAGAVLSDTLPAGLLPVGVITWHLGTLAAGDSGTVLLTATVGVTTAAHATLTNTAMITTTTPDGDATNNRTQAVNELIQMADLALSKAVTPAVVQSGDLLTYTLSFTNTGPATASNVILTDTLPPGLTPGGVLTWHLGAVPPGDGGILVVTATVDLTGTAYALLTNTALIAGSTPEAGYGNNTAQVVSTLLQAADLRLTKSVEPAIAQAGAVLTYTLTFTNAGLANAAELRITDTLPAAVTFGGMVEMEPSLFGPIVAEPTLAWYTSTLPAGATGSLAFTVAVLPDVWGVLTNTAVITSVTPEQNPADNQDMVTHLIEKRNCSIYLPVILKASRYVPYSVYLPIIRK